jgi:lipopolysaccharide export system protein LptA
VLRHAVIASALVLLALPAPSARAQLLGGDSSQPIEIQADSGIEWRQNEQLYIARGHAIAKRGSSEVHADTLIAHYRPLKPGAAAATGAAGTPNAGTIGGNTEIYRVDAQGNVTLNRDAQTVVGDDAVYDVDQSLAVITGKGLKLTTATDMVTARDSLEWYDQKQVAVARGDAVATRNGKTIKADVLTAYMVKSAPQTAATAKPAPIKPAAAAGRATAPTQESKISRVDAQGHVVVTNAAETGHGDYAVYNAVKGVSTLIGNVVITRGKDVMHGQAAVMDMNKNVSRILPSADIPGANAKPGQPQRVQGLFQREDAAAARGARPTPATGKPQ